jgi:hypothetical protein
MPDPVVSNPTSPVASTTATPATAIQTIEQRAKTLPETVPWYGWLGIGVVSGLIIGKVLR